MIQWAHSIPIYLHRDSVDFRKAINGLALIVEQEMALSPFEPGLFVFCNKRRSQLKVLYWDKTGFALWQKRLEKDRFKWPKRHKNEIVTLNEEQWGWLLRGLDFQKIQPLVALNYQSIA